MGQTGNSKVIGERYPMHKDKQLAEKVSNGSHQHSGRCSGLACTDRTCFTRSEMSEMHIFGGFKRSSV